MHRFSQPCWGVSETFSISYHLPLPSLDLSRGFLHEMWWKMSYANVRVKRGQRCGREHDLIVMWQSQAFFPKCWILPSLVTGSENQWWSPGCRKEAKTCCFCFWAPGQLGQCAFESCTMCTENKHLIWALPVWNKPSLFRKSALDLSNALLRKTNGLLSANSARINPGVTWDASRRLWSMTAGMTLTDQAEN